MCHVKDRSHQNVVCTKDLTCWNVDRENSHETSSEYGKCKTVTDRTHREWGKWKMTKLTRNMAGNKDSTRLECGKRQGQDRPGMWHGTRTGLTRNVVKEKRLNSPGMWHGTRTALTRNVARNKDRTHQECGTEQGQHSPGMWHGTRTALTGNVARNKDSTHQVCGERKTTKLTRNMARNKDNTHQECGKRRGQDWPWMWHGQIIELTRNVARSNNRTNPECGTVKGQS